MRSTYANGFWVMAGAEVIRDALQQPEIFSSTVVTVLDSDPPYKWIPEMLDPPEHTVWRQLLAPHFAPRAMERLEEKVRGRCVDVLSQFAAEGHCDFCSDFAWRYPTTIFMELMGLPLEGLEQFLEWEHQILHPSAGADPEESQSQAFDAMMAVMGYFSELIEEKRANPSDDLLSSSLAWTIDEKPIPMEDLLSWCLLMFMAGLDTVSIQLAWLRSGTWPVTPTIWSRMAEDPSVIPSAVEELLRYFAFVAPASQGDAGHGFPRVPAQEGRHGLRAVERSDP